MDYVIEREPKDTIVVIRAKVFKTQMTTEIQKASLSN